MTEWVTSRYRGPEDEDAMNGLYLHCTFNLNPRAPSIDTPLHAFIGREHVDHMHPDAVIAIAASSDSRELTQQIYGDEFGWLLAREDRDSDSTRVRRWRRLARWDWRWQARRVFPASR